MMRLFGRSRLGLYLALLLLAAACGGIRKVGGGGAWRSPQPSLEDVEFAIQGLGVKTVISLRAAKPGVEWYDAQAEVCRRLGVEFVSHGWSARSLSDAKVDALVKTFEQHPGPYLIHCRAGKDRCSLASAIYRYVVLGHDKEDAESELSVLNGHIAAFGYEAIDEAWERFVERRDPGRVSGAESPPPADHADR